LLLKLFLKLHEAFEDAKHDEILGVSISVHSTPFPKLPFKSFLASM
jgi:hypothetical protein